MLLSGKQPIGCLLAVIDFIRKTLTVVASVAILLQSFAPFIAAVPQIAYAQEVSPTDTPAPTDTTTPSPTNTVTPTDTTSPTPSDTITPTDSVTPTDTVSPTPDTSATTTPSDTPTDTVTPTDSVTPTDTATPTTDQTNPTSNQNNTNNPSQAPPSVTPSTTLAPTDSSNTPESGDVSATVLSHVSAPSLDLSTSQDASATLSTDKADYAPTDTAVITGNGFTASKVFSLTISSTDTPATSTTVSITTDDKGSFVYAYQLDGNYRPNYSVVVKDGETTIATTTFTDGPLTSTILSWDTIGIDSNKPISAGPHQYIIHDRITNTAGTTANALVATFLLGAGTASPYISAVGPITQNVGDLAAGASIDVFFQVLITPQAGQDKPSNAAFGTSRAYTITTTSSNVSSVTANGTLTIQGLNSQNRNGIDSHVVAPNTLHIGDIFTVTATSNTSSSFTNISVPMTYDPSVVQMISDTTTYQTPSDTESDFYSQNEGGNITSVFTFKALAAGSTNFNWIIYDQSGGSYHYNADFGNAIVVSIQPQFSITKTPATQTVNAGSPASFTATVSNTGNGAGSISTIVDTLPAGFTYVNGSTTGITTSDPTVVGQQLTWTGPWNVNAGGSIAVSYQATSSSTPGTYTNTVSAFDNNNNTIGPATSQIIVNPSTGTLTVNKVTVPSSDTTTQFSITASGSGTITGKATQTITGGGSVQYTVTAGTYSVAEAAQTGWTTTSNTCSNVQVIAGGSASCTITNTKLPTLKVIKTVINNNGGTATSSAFTLHVTASGTDVSGSPAAGSSTGTTYTLNPGTYSVSENDPTSLGYTSTGITGDCASNGSITLAAGDNKTCTITNDDVAPSLTLVKQVSNTHGGTAQPTDFTLTASGSSTLSGPGGAASDGTFKAGIYTLSETNLSGYLTGTWNCTNGVNVNANNQITLGLAQSTTCTITNSDIAPTLKLVKVVNNNNGGTAQPADFTLTASGSGGFSDKGDSTTFHTVLANTTYTLSESGPSGYTGTSWSCSAGSLNGNQLALGLNQNVTCTITNNDQPATLIVKKIVKNLHGGTKTASDFSFQVNNGTATKFNSNGENDLTVKAGTYSVSEVAAYGYTTSYDNCSNVTIGNGQTATCTITNTDIAPRLTVIKHVINDNGGTASASAFTMLVNGTNVSSTIFPGDENGTTVTLDQGSYSAGEIANSGYSSAFSADCSGTINVGDSKTCTITNDDIPATLIVKKHVINDNNGTKSASDFTMQVSGNNVSTPSFSGNESGTTITLDAGSYSADEGSHDGYTKTLGTDCSGTIANGETKSCTITNDDIAPSLTLLKQVINTNGGVAKDTDWTLSATGSGQSATNLSGTTPVVSGNTFKADTYTLAEANGPSGYSASNWSCTNGITVTNGQITLKVGDSTTCTITNSDIAPTLKLVKQVINNNGGTAKAGDWTLNTTGASGFSDTGDSTTFHTVLANTTYTLSESNGPTGYTAGNWSCSGGSLKGDQLTLGLNQNVTCTITNNDNAPSLTLIKFVSGGTSQATDFTLSATGPTTISGLGGAVSDTKFSAGTYTLSETGPAGYTGDSWGCAGGIQDGNKITVGLGESAVCTITNTRDTGSIVIHKKVDTTGTGTFDGDDTTANRLGFTWNLDNGADNAFGASVSAVTTLDTHTISENTNNNPYHFVGWYPTDSQDFSCTNPEGKTLPANLSLTTNGETASITLCNQRDTGTLIVNKLADTTGNDDYSSLNPSTFTWGTDPNVTTNVMGQSTQIITGTYNIYENNVSGYKFTGWFYGNPEENDFSCSNLPEEKEFQSLPTNLTVSSNQTTEITLCNQIQIPVLTITKTNNQLNNLLNPGSAILYTITITATQSAADNVALTDLLPKGFVYQDGSATINYGEGAQPFTNFSDDYHSPGIWDIGHLDQNQTVTLTLNATINNDEDPGTYQDVAWAQGSVVGDPSQTVLALAQPLGYVDNNFVGTQATVVKDQQDNPTINVINQQDVLGAATSILPDTGANTLWVILGAILAMAGIITISFGIILKKRYV